MIVGELKVTSHVARDLLQSAALFRHEHSVVWEYVSNGLEYLDHGVQPVVDVMIDAKVGKITIRDNGRGMSRSDLEQYFQMHGENIDRKKGKPGRGMFGTGKSAAFGIGDVLRLTTVRNRLRCKVQLARKDVAEATDGSAIPVESLEKNIPTNEPNGTVVEIEGIHLKRIDVGSIVRHIERHIAHWPNATVIVNHQECKVTEPASSFERRISSAGTAFEAKLGVVELVIKIAKAPLDQEWQGIAIVASGVWHTTTLAGCDGKPFANYIFGQLDVPSLARDTSPIPPFDMSRSMRLNPKNETVNQIFAFVGSQVEIVRRELERNDLERRKERDAKRLLDEASAIARFINKDFADWRQHIQRTLAKMPGGSDRLTGSGTGTGEGETLVPGPDIPAIVIGETGGIGGPNGNGPIVDTDTPNDTGQRLDRASDNESAVTTATPRKKPKAGTSGGFSVDFMHMGEQEARAKYEREHRTIFINLDHPQIAAALALGGIEDITFRRLSYEVAFSEYAIALSSELAGGDWYHDITDPIVDIRDTLNRISRAAASLYSTK